MIRFCRECADIGPEQIAQLRTRRPRSSSQTLPLLRTGSARRFAYFRSWSAPRPPGPVWEHFEIGSGPVRLPPLKSKRFDGRLPTASIGSGIVRDVLTVHDRRPAIQPSDSAVFPTGSTWYRPNWSTYRYRPDEGAPTCWSARLPLGASTASTRVPARGSRFASSQPGRPAARAHAPARSRASSQRRDRGQACVTCRRGTFFGQILPAALAGSGAFDLVLFAFNRGSPDAPSAFPVSLAAMTSGTTRVTASVSSRATLTRPRRSSTKGTLARVLNRADLPDWRRTCR